MAAGMQEDTFVPSSQQMMAEVLASPDRLRFVRRLVCKGLWTWRPGLNPPSSDSPGY